MLGTAQILGLSPIHGGIADLPFREGVGPSGGLRLRFADDLMAVLQGRFLYLPVQTPRQTYSAEAAIRYQYIRNFALGVEGRYQPEAQSVQGMSYIYF